MRLTSQAEALQHVVTQLADDAVQFVVARLKRRMFDKFDQFGLVSTIGADRFFPTVREAVFGAELPPDGETVERGD